MLPEQKANTNIGIGLGIALIVVFRVLPKGTFPPAVASFIGIAGSALYLWGCISYAIGKGQSPLWGFIALIPFLGLLILVALPDDESAGASPMRRGCGYTAIVIMLGLGGIFGWLIYRGYHLSPTTPGPGAPPATRALSVEEAQRRALELHPALGIANSPLNREFVARYKKYQVTNKDYFRDPRWPLTLADESQAAIARSQAR